MRFSDIFEEQTSLDMTKKLNYFNLFVIVGMLFLSSCQLGGAQDCGPDFNDTEGIKNHIVGKWRTDLYYIDHTRYYRFDITKDKITYWISMDGKSWDSEPDGEVGYQLGSLTSHHAWGECRRLVLDEEVLALSMKGYSLVYIYNQFDDCYSLVYDNGLKSGW